MKKIVLFILMITLCSCKTIHHDDINPTISPNTTLLPAMEPLVDMDSLFSVYGRVGTVSTNQGISNNNDNNMIASYSNTQINTDNIYINDTIGIFNKEVKDNITNQYGKNKGYIILKLDNPKYTNNVFASAGYFTATLGCYFTLGLVCMTGVPLGAVNQTIDVEVVILNLNKEKIKSYKETVYDKEFVAAWWGYVPVAVSRKVYATNIKNALEKIRLQIDKDALEIRKALN